jgi:hypothetical protein
MSRLQHALEIAGVEFIDEERWRSGYENDTKSHRSAVALTWAACALNDCILAERSQIVPRFQWLEKSTA